MSETKEIGVPPLTHPVAQPPKPQLVIQYPRGNKVNDYSKLATFLRDNPVHWELEHYEHYEAEYKQYAEDVFDQDDDIFVAPIIELKQLLGTGLNDQYRFNNFPGMITREGHLMAAGLNETRGGAVHPDSSDEDAVEEVRPRFKPRRYTPEEIQKIIRAMPPQRYDKIPDETLKTYAELGTIGWKHL